METIEIKLTEQEFSRLNSIYPATVKSSTVGKRAEELVKFYFRSIDPKCKFTEPNDGADLLVELKNESVKLEIKGTASDTVSWSKLKVSSLDSHKLIQDGLPVYRVISVYDRNPKILVLRYGEDFTMEPEPRWAVKRVQA